MAKPRKRKSRRNVQPGELPTPEQVMKGDAVREFVTHAESATKAMAHRVAHDSIEKWKRKGYLNSVELQTIERMQDIWQSVYGELSLTGSYGERVASNGCEQGLRSQERQLALRAALRDVEALFPGPVKTYYSTFERICRFGEHPMDVLGNRDKALTVVKFVANLIAAKKVI